MSVRPATDGPPLFVTSGDRTRAHGAPVDTGMVNRVRAEFADMRGFSPTLTQAARLFGLTPAACERVLERLVDARVLEVTADGCYRLRAG
jgi:hypothetical protein